MGHTNLFSNKYFREDLLHNISKVNLGFQRLCYIGFGRLKNTPRVRRSMLECTFLRKNSLKQY